MRFIVSFFLILAALTASAQDPIQLRPFQLKEGVAGDVLTSTSTGVAHRRAAMLTDTQTVTGYAPGDVVKIATTGVMYRAVIAAPFPFNLADAAWFPVDTKLTQPEVVSFESDLTALNAISLLLDSINILRLTIDSLRLDSAKISNAANRLGVAIDAGKIGFNPSLLPQFDLAPDMQIPLYSPKDTANGASTVYALSAAVAQARGSASDSYTTDYTADDYYTVSKDSVMVVLDVIDIYGTTRPISGFLPGGGNIEYEIHLTTASTGIPFTYADYLVTWSSSGVVINQAVEGSKFNAPVLDVVENALIVRASTTSNLVKVKIHFIRTENN